MEKQTLSAGNLKKILRKITITTILSLNNYMGIILLIIHKNQKVNLISLISQKEKELVIANHLNKWVNK